MRPSRYGPPRWRQSPYRHLRGTYGFGQKLRGSGLCCVRLDVLALWVIYRQPLRIDGLRHPFLRRWFTLRCFGRCWSEFLFLTPTHRYGLLEAVQLSSRPASISGSEKPVKIRRLWLSDGSCVSLTEYRQGTFTPSSHIHGITAGGNTPLATEGE